MVIIRSIPQKKYQNRTICIPSEKHEYQDIVESAEQFRLYIDRMWSAFPELFPKEIEKGYELKDIRYSKKIGISIRRIKIGETSYSIRPSFVTPNLTAYTQEVEGALFLRKFGVPFWALVKVFGRNPMYWYRLEQNIGCNSIIGTTIKDPEKIPKHLCADEKHSRINKDKVYIATTVGNDCVLGADVSRFADEFGLIPAYRTFKKEAQDLNADYQPQTVGLDGWKATSNAWNHLFPRITIILCFLHVYIKIRDRSKRRYKALFKIFADKFWKAYRKNRRHSFSQSIRRIHEWAQRENAPDVILKPITKMRDKLQSYAQAYDFPKSHRTSNMLDRIMQRMDRFIFSNYYFHGKTLHSATNSIRAWALIHNFAPWNPHTTKKRGYSCPAEKINQFRYHDSWLQNLYISASLRGFKTFPQNP